MAKSEKQDFESALAELNTIVTKMEKGELSLEESLKQFERGVKLTQVCQSALRDAEQKVKILTEQNNELSLEPFTDKE